MTGAWVLDGRATLDPGSTRSRTVRHSLALLGCYIRLFLVLDGLPVKAIELHLPWVYTLGHRERPFNTTPTDVSHSTEQPEIVQTPSKTVNCLFLDVNSCIKAILHKQSQPLQTRSNRKFPPSSADARRELTNYHITNKQIKKTQANKKTHTKQNKTNN